MKIRVRGYRGIRYWRYRAECPCGWSHDIPAEYLGYECAAIRDHQLTCHRQKIRAHP